MDGRMNGGCTRCNNSHWLDRYGILLSSSSLSILLFFLFGFGDDANSIQPPPPPTPTASPPPTIENQSQSIPHRNCVPFPSVISVSTVVNPPGGVDTVDEMLIAQHLGQNPARGNHWKQILISNIKI